NSWVIFAAETDEADPHQGPCIASWAKPYDGSKPGGIPLLQQMERPRFGDGLRTAPHVQFAIEVGDVFLDRVHTQGQVTSDLAVGGTIQNQPQHVVLTCCERFHERTALGVCRSRFARSRQQFRYVPRYQTVPPGSNSTSTSPRPLSVGLTRSSAMRTRARVRYSRSWR